MIEDRREDPRMAEEPTYELELSQREVTMLIRALQAQANLVFAEANNEPLRSAARSRLQGRSFDLKRRAKRLAIEIGLEEA